MPNVIHCDMCQQEHAQVMQTNVDNGDVLAVGPNCLLVFYLTVAQEMLDLMPAENIAAYGSALTDVVTRLGGHIDRGGQVAEADAMTGDEVATGHLPTDSAAAEAELEPVYVDDMNAVAVIHGERDNG